MEVGWGWGWDGEAAFTRGFQMARFVPTWQERIGMHRKKNRGGGPLFASPTLFKFIVSASSPRGSPPYDIILHKILCPALLQHCRALLCLRELAACFCGAPSHGFCPDFVSFQVRSPSLPKFALAHLRFGRLIFAGFVFTGCGDALRALVCFVFGVWRCRSVRLAGGEGEGRSHCGA